MTDTDDLSGLVRRLDDFGAELSDTAEREQIRRAIDVIRKHIAEPERSRGRQVDPMQPGHRPGFVQCPTCSEWVPEMRIKK